MNKCPNCGEIVSGLDFSKLEKNIGKDGMTRYREIGSNKVFRHVCKSDYVTERMKEVGKHSGESREQKRRDAEALLIEAGYLDDVPTHIRLLAENAVNGSSADRRIWLQTIGQMPEKILDPEREPEKAAVILGISQDGLFRLMMLRVCARLAEAGETSALEIIRGEVKEEVEIPPTDEIEPENIYQEKINTIMKSSKYWGDRKDEYGLPAQRRRGSPFVLLT